MQTATNCLYIRYSKNGGLSIETAIYRAFWQEYKSEAAKRNFDFVLKRRIVFAQKPV